MPTEQFANFQYGENIWQIYDSADSGGIKVKKKPE